MNRILDAIQRDRVIAIARNIPAEEICALAEAILLGGLHLMEVTFNHAKEEGIANTIKSIQLLNERFAGTMFIGAGTVLTEREVGLAADAEIRFARDCGADLVKLFPASALGPAYIKALAGPMPEIPLLATGGINPGNIAQYIAAGAAGAGVGGNLVSLSAVRAGDFAAIADVARQYVAAVQGA